MESRKKIINGQNYEVGHLPAFYNYNFSIKFGHVTGPSFPKIGGMLSEVTDLTSLFEAKINLAELGEAIKCVFDSLYEKDRDGSFMLEVMSQTRRNGVAINKGTFDQFYTGNMAEMKEALLFTVNVHFGFFLFGNSDSSGSIKEEEQKK